jgi:hypothetical protein
MRTRRRATIHELRLAVDSLPHATRVAMLAGIRSNDIIAGAYSDQNGICPMLAAHRAGGRTSFISFAQAWDAFAFRGERPKSARRATDRELLILATHLRASLLADEAPALDLADAIAEHHELLAHRAAGRRERPADRRPHPAARHRAGESRTRRCWAPRRIPRRGRERERERTPDAYLSRGGTGRD